MCLAIPARVVELLPGLRAIVDLSGVRKEVSIDLVDDAQVDDYVIIHVGYALGKIDPEEALRTLALFAELSEAQNSLQPLQSVGETLGNTSQGSAMAKVPATLLRTSRRKLTPAAATTSWSFAVATRMPFRATALPTCCRLTCA